MSSRFKGHLVRKVKAQRALHVLLGIIAEEVVVVGQFIQDLPWVGSLLQLLLASSVRLRFGVMYDVWSQEEGLFASVLVPTHLQTD